MMTPDERYALQAVLADLEAAASGIRALLDLGENPHISAAAYKAQLDRCRCEFGWQPECPQHGTPEHRLTRDEDPCSAPDHTPGNACPPPEDHQDERPQVTTFAPASHERHWFGCDQKHGPEAWCPTAPQAVIDRHNAALRGDIEDGKDRLYNVNPHAHQPGPDDHIVGTAEEAEAGYQRRLMRSHRPTPRDVFGGREEDQVGG